MAASWIAELEAFSSEVSKITAEQQGGKHDKFALNVRKKQLCHRAEAVYAKAAAATCVDGGGLLTEEGLASIHERLVALRRALLLEASTGAGAEGIRKALMLVRLALTFGTTMLVGLWLLLLSPLRLAHPFLRKRGIRNGSLPLDVLMRLAARAILASAGVAVKCRIDAGSSGGGGGAKVLMFSHGSNLDPLVVQACCPDSCKWIGKKSIFYIPFFGWAALTTGMLPISRGNRAKAIHTLSLAAKGAAKHGRSIAISPEGTRSKTGHLGDFKKGPFHLQNDTQAAVQVCVIKGAYELWAPKQPFTSTGQVRVHFLPLIPPRKDRSRAELSRVVRQKMLDALQQVDYEEGAEGAEGAGGAEAAPPSDDAAAAAKGPPAYPGVPLSWKDVVVCCLTVLANLGLAVMTRRLFAALVAAASLSSYVCNTKEMGEGRGRGWVGGVMAGRVVVRVSIARPDSSSSLSGLPACLLVDVRPAFFFFFGLLVGLNSMHVMVVLLVLTIVEGVVVTVMY